MSAPLKQAKNGRRWTLFAILAVTIAPVLVSYLTYYIWKPAGGKSYGELLPVRPVPTFKLSTTEGAPATLADLKGKWLLVMADSASCDRSCLDTLYALRQYRLAQGKEMDRVERIWLVTDTGQPSAAALKQADGAQIRHALEPIPLPKQLDDSIYLIDPLGNQVMRYPRTAEPRKVIKELTGLLKNNENIG
ncbi:SCO family protein [Chitinimonas sp. BJB300]|uniref:SCO family protein n=1 Tax=Chitinimonas sp. BJB300 TaxID=1559339 RepID=UPI000C110C10|nr:cytochrome C oxidase subunit I [Chitinimonas sp. BJB300]PHV11614.1 cytochrome C oxidase subunit I [Chitinimonas sp. BJB300]TSJ88102.1 cytochrome C oxidase subunit I [Chitinimonas sp. BJB300]